jgi:hypothetical protein
MGTRFELKMKDHLLTVVLLEEALQREESLKQEVNQLKSLVN